MEAILAVPLPPISTAVGAEDKIEEYAGYYSNKARELLMKKINHS